MAMQGTKINKPMKLFSTPNSPFSRMARIVVHELELSDEVEVEFVTVRDPHSELLKYGPLGKVPALQLNGMLFSDSRIVVHMLESLSDKAQLSARNNEPQFLALEGFCVGFMESVGVWIREARRTPELTSQDLLNVEAARALRCVKHLSQQTEDLSNNISLASIAVACALDLAYRRLDFNEFENYSDLNEWFKGMLKRDSFKMTEPLPV